MMMMNAQLTHVMKQLDVNTVLLTVMMTMIVLLIHVITQLAVLILLYAVMTMMQQLLTFVFLPVDVNTTKPNATLLMNVRASLLM
jgi:hypothetical protein